YWSKANMAKRDNHYEAAFEEFLRQRCIPYVAVDEQRRSCVAGGTIKNVDFIVSPAGGVTLLVDVKGRRFPSGSKHKQYWKNWATWDDLESLSRWQRQLGEGSLALLAFTYQIVGDQAPLPQDRLFPFRDQWYAFLGVRAADYVRFARPLSRRWNTIALAAPRFREAAFPLEELLPYASNSPSSEIGKPARPDYSGN
ncbi:MAG: HYExAFE family protein, partial [Planctomycetales bacterium]|nr:HYExAFE family protein [Planctomycetales bacterium]